MSDNNENSNKLSPSSSLRAPSPAILNTHKPPISPPSTHQTPHTTHHPTATMRSHADIFKDFISDDRKTVSDDPTARRRTNKQIAALLQNSGSKSDSGGSHHRGVATSTNSKLKGISNRTLAITHTHTHTSAHTSASTYTQSTRTSFSDGGVWDLVSVSSASTEILPHTSSHTPVPTHHGGGRAHIPTGKGHTPFPHTSSHTPLSGDGVYGSEPNMHTPEEDAPTHQHAIKKHTSFPTHTPPHPPPHTTSHTPAGKHTSMDHIPHTISHTPVPTHQSSSLYEKLHLDGSARGLWACESRDSEEEARMASASTHHLVSGGSHTPPGECVPNNTPGVCETGVSGVWGDHTPVPIHHPGDAVCVFFIGDAGVGKTSIIRALCGEPAHSPTTGVHVHYLPPAHGKDSTSTSTTQNNNNCDPAQSNDDSPSYTLQLWDTPGEHFWETPHTTPHTSSPHTISHTPIPTHQQQQPQLLKSYYARAHAYGLVCDLTNYPSILSIPLWIDMVRGLAHTPPLTPEQQVPILLIGNKADQPGRVLPSEQLEAYALSSGCMGYVETSVALNVNIPLAVRAMGLAGWRFREGTSATEVVAGEGTKEGGVIVTPDDAPTSSHTPPITKDHPPPTTEHTPTHTETHTPPPLTTSHTPPAAHTTTTSNDTTHHAPNTNTNTSTGTSIANTTSTSNTTSASTSTRPPNNPNNPNHPRSSRNDTKVESSGGCACVVS